MSRRLVVSGGSRPLELVLVGTMIVGRDPACDISETNDPLMSRRHAAFNAGPREVIVRDLGSRNGILVNGVKTPESVLKSGDVVQIGHLQVRYVDEVGPFRDVPLADGPLTEAGDAAATKILEDQTKLSQAVTVKISDLSVTKKIQ
jgi:pSer/pThr/pTyr-binding forkhead associated (FHA) protein